VEVCDVCGATFDVDGYHVVVERRRYDSIECALRAQAAASRRRGDATAEWVAAARRHIGVAENSPNVEHDHDDH